jgi:uncharacterized protein (DUF305 family)
MFPFSRLSLLAALLLAAFVPLSGCDSAEADDGESAVVDDQTDDPRAFVPANDLAYVDFLQPHHMDATEMAEMVVERGERTDVEAFAQRMLDVQGAEIALLRTVRTELAGSPDSPPMDNPHMEADMEEMMGLSGTALDEFFLTHMLPHHADAVAVSHNALPNLDRQDMRDMAMDVIEMQSAEIEEIRMLLGGG